MEKSKVMGHIFAIITILVWGSCFVLTKNLLVDFTPIQIIPLRMGLAYVTLWIRSRISGLMTNTTLSNPARAAS